MTKQLELSGLKREWIDDCESRVAIIGYALGQFTADDLHGRIPKPEHHNWYGVLLAKLKNVGVVRRVGYRPSERQQANGRVVAVWEVV